MDKYRPPPPPGGRVEAHQMVYIQNHPERFLSINHLAYWKYSGSQM